MARQPGVYTPPQGEGEPPRGDSGGPGNYGGGPGGTTPETAYETIDPAQMDPTQLVRSYWTLHHLGDDLDQEDIGVRDAILGRLVQEHGWRTDESGNVTHWRLPHQYEDAAAGINIRGRDNIAAVPWETNKFSTQRYLSRMEEGESDWRDQQHSRFAGGMEEGNEKAYNAAQDHKQQYMDWLSSPGKGMPRGNGLMAGGKTDPTARTRPGPNISYPTFADMVQNFGASLAHLPGYDPGTGMTKAYRGIDVLKHVVPSYFGAAKSLAGGFPDAVGVFGATNRGPYGFGFPNVVTPQMTGPEPDWGDPGGFGRGGDPGSMGAGSGAHAPDGGPEHGGHFRHGGYTGAGHDQMVQPDQPAGTVHEGEYVLPHEVVNQMGPQGRDSLDRLIMRAKRKPMNRPMNGLRHHMLTG